jgi:hypothetical protein
MARHSLFRLGRGRLRRAPVPVPPLWIMLARYVGLDDRQRDRTWQAIAAATWSVPTAWREAVWLLDSRAPSVESVAAFLAAVASPPRVAQVVEALGPLVAGRR